MARLRDGKKRPLSITRPPKPRYRILVPMPRDDDDSFQQQQKKQHFPLGLAIADEIPLPLKLLGLALVCNFLWLSLFAQQHQQSSLSNHAMIMGPGRSLRTSSLDSGSSGTTSKNGTNEHVLVVIVSNRLSGILPTVSSVLAHTRSKPVDLVLVGDPVVNEQVRQHFAVSVVVATNTNTKNTTPDNNNNSNNNNNNNDPVLRPAAHSFTSLTVETVTKDLLAQGIRPIWTWPEWGSSRTTNHNNTNSTSTSSSSSSSWSNEHTIHRAEWDELETHAHELNHLRFYLPQVSLFSNHNHLYFLDDDILVRKDLGEVADASLAALHPSKGLITPCNIWMWNSECHHFDFKNVDAIDPILKMPSLYGDRNVCRSASESHCYPASYHDFIDAVLPRNATGARATKGWNFGFSLFALEHWRALNLTQHYERVMKANYAQHVFPETSLTFGLGAPYLALAGAVECWNDELVRVRDGFGFIEWQRYQASFGSSGDSDFLDAVDVLHYTGPEKPWNANTTIDARSLAPWFASMAREGLATPPQLAAAPVDDQPLFTLLAADRSGAQWIMAALDSHPSVCASGETNRPESGFPVDILLPPGLPWFPACSIKRGCSYAFVRDAVLELAQTMDARGRYGLIPPRCHTRRSNDALGSHLPRVCNVIERLHGNFTAGAIEKVWVKAFQQQDQSLLGCSCPRGTTIQGLKVLTDWLTPRNFPFDMSGPASIVLDDSALSGQKVIRVHRSNLWARYKSAKLAQVSGMYHVTTAGEKRAQLTAVGSTNVTISIEDMLRQIEVMEAIDEWGDNWAIVHGSNVMKVEYEDCRANTATCFEGIFEFLAVDPTHVSKHAARFQSDFASFAEQDSTLDGIANAGAVREALASSGYADFIGGIEDYSEVQLLVYDDSSARDKMHQLHQEKGINATMFGALDPQHDNTSGYSAKFSAAINLLSAMKPDALVVLSNSRDVRLQFPVGSDSSRYEAIADFRTAFAKMTRDFPGAVVASAESHCCASALTHGKPGDYYSGNGERKKRSCVSGQPGCEWAGDNMALPWQRFMEELAGSRSQADAGDIYLDASLIVGKAQDLLQFINATNVGYGEDDRAVLTDYMYHNRDLLLLDYDRQLFGRNREGRHSETNRACPFGPNTDSGTATKRRQLEDESTTAVSAILMHSPRELGCLANEKAQDTTIFPAWDEGGIRIGPILDHLERVADAKASIVFPFGTALNDYSQGPEIPYFVDNKSIWTSKLIRDRTDEQTTDWRMVPTESLLQMALAILKRDVADTRWNTLRDTLASGGFPYWAWYGDFKRCNKHNYRNESIPVLTPSARADCDHAFPVPNYMTVIDSQRTSDNWRGIFRDEKAKFPWETKKRQVVWRGALSEADRRYVLNSTRWRVNKVVHGLDSDLYDVGLTSVPKWISDQVEIDVSSVGGVVGNIEPMSAFQTYQAVLDMDGNSWSSRFGTLLCYNSVVIKVEARHVEYFYSDLRPWVHFIPVRDDLSDLHENVAWALDPKNEATVRDIIASANEFCSQRFTQEALARDVLDTWEAYVRLLYINDPEWQKQWLRKKSLILSATSKFDLIRLKAKKSE